MNLRSRIIHIRQRIEKDSIREKFGFEVINSRTHRTMRRRPDFSEPYEQKAGHREKLEMNMFKFIPTGTAKRKFAIFPVVQESEQHFVTKHKETHRRYRVDEEKCLDLVFSACKFKFDMVQVMVVLF